MIEEDFRTRTTWAGITHRPEVVGGGNADNLVIGKARELFPQARSLLIVVIDGDVKPLGVEAEFLGDQVPGKWNGIGLEVIAE